jgi:hypothetical protein
LKNSGRVKEEINKIFTFNEFKKIIDDYYNYLINENKFEDLTAESAEKR